MSVEARNYRRLMRAFAALRQEYTEEPAPRVEAFLLAQMRANRAARHARMWSLAVASIVLALAGILFAARYRVPASSRSTAAVSVAYPAAADQADGFLAIPYAEPLAPSEQVDVYRVQMPGATLAHYGFPVRAGSVDSPVIADVAVGSDGVVRALRVVH